MADDTQAGAPQAGATADQPQVGNAPQGQEPQVFDAEYVGKLRTEAASYRTKHALAEKRLKEIEEGQLSEVQKLQKQLDAALSERDGLVKEARQARVMSAASKAMAKYPDVVARMVPDDATDFDSAVKEVRKAYPDMFRTSSADGGAGNNGNEAPLNMNQLIRQGMKGRS